MAEKQPTAPTPGTPPKKEPIKEQLPKEMVKALADEGYKETQVLATRSYKEQKIWRVTTSDGQRHEISYDGKLISGGSLAKRKERAAAEAKKKKADK